MTRTILKRADLEAIGAVHVCSIKNGEYIDIDGKAVLPNREILSESGFYFLVRGRVPGYVRKTLHQCDARYYVGRQRCKQGFTAVVNSIRRRISNTSYLLATNNIGYDVLFVPTTKMKPLTTGYGKGQIAMAFTSSHNDRYQNLQEMNRMLNDNFKFYYQVY